MERGKSYCYRVESRTMFPGLKKVKKDRQGQDIVVNDPNVFTVIEGLTEHYVTPNGYTKPKIGNMYMNEFFGKPSHAIKMANKMHKGKRCESSKCGWTSEKPAEKSEAQKKADTLAGMFGPIIKP